MNCEKCKNRKATLFYADEGGGRHALCATCGATKSKLTTTLTASESEGEEKAPCYLPAPSLTALLTHTEKALVATPKDPSVKCPACATTADRIAESGTMGCPRCYTVFADLFPAPLCDKSFDTTNARMPSQRRKRMEKEAAITRLREELRTAIEGESFELAAVLRDKIRNLEAAT